MFKFISSQAKFLTSAIIGLVVLPLMTTTAHAALATDLQSLATQASSINTQMSVMSLNADNSCSELSSVIASVESFTASIESVSANLTAPLSMDVDSLNALDSLSVSSAGIAAFLPLFSTDITAISTVIDQADIQASLDAMLKLSDDIGVMADRILEMADLILAMADNIGLAADQIIATQTL